jgi:hypothetical protein
VFSAAFTISLGPAQSATQSVTFHIDRLTVATTFLNNGTLGSPYNASLPAVGLAPFTWSVWNGSLPPGLSISGSAIVGTPTASGFYSFTIRALDAVGQAAYRNLSINIP